ncbi:Rv0361 family membrane protein [Actinotalea fermentans]|uniref:DUF4878 domain-containing protein n=1 Tax=Actinotalea fermentans TaxID=43671 RepID=A0A511Z0U4_9CELL|nr:hypothetical protein [Actinotalea fermentans]GEN81059.1 hypothetical protein AFE02nite_27930 [Actinotalea fermentans]
MTFPPPPPGPPNQPPQPGQWQPAAQPPMPPQPPYGQPPMPPQPPYPQQQAYGQPPMPPMPPAAPAPGWQPAVPFEPTPAPGRGWVVPAVVVGSLVVIGGVFALSAAGDVGAGSGAADRARDAVVRLTTAMHEGDCEGVQESTTGGYFRAMNLTCADIADNGAWMDEVGMSFVVGDAELDGASAKVPVELVAPGDPSQGGTGTFTVVRTGDTWRVSNDQMD